MTDDPPVTEDRLLGGRVTLYQPAEGFRAALDPVLLAAACPAAGGERVLELGCGSGAASLCLLARQPGLSVTGLELQGDLAALARRSAAASGLGRRFEAVAGDVAEPPAALRGGRFDHVIANPPWLPAARSRVGDAARALARLEGPGGLDAWIAAANGALRRGGWLTLIHRADRLDALCATLPGRFGALEILPLWPRAGVPARRVILRARKGARGPAALLPGLVLHEADGRFTAAAEAVLRDAAPLRGAGT